MKITLTQEQIEKNIRSAYEQASTVQKSNGFDWYLTAHDTAVMIAGYFNITIEQAAAIIAVLSPRNKWERNIKDAISVLRFGLDCKVATFGINHGKALNIIEGAPICDHLKGNKVNAFASLITNPLDSQTVCVDTWAIALALDINPNQVGNMTDKNYASISAAYVKVAQELSILPWQLQAITWLWIREQSYDLVPNVNIADVKTWLEDEIEF